MEKAYPFQRFTVAVPETTGAKEFSVNWTGSVPADQRAQLSAWNHEDSAWVELDAGSGSGLALQGTAPVDGFVVDGEATILVQNRPAAILDDDSSLRILWLTDTQYYSAGNSPQTYYDITQWALDNKEEEDIAYAIHTGDIVDNANVESQWHVPDGAHRTWDEAGFPYGVLPGNHDINGSYSNFTSYHQWFPASRFEDNPWYGGSSRNNADHYDVFSTPDADYLVLYLGTALTPVEYAWASDIIEAHPNHNVIIAVHHVLTMGGGHDYEYQARDIYDRLIVPNDNVGMMIGGHHCSPVTRTSHPTEDRTVYEIMFDPQCNPNGGDGWLRFIDLDAENGTMEHSTFSIKKEGNQYWPEGQPNSIGDISLTENENFLVDYELQTATRSLQTESLSVVAQASAPIQDATVTVESGERASLSLESLDEEMEYFWYVTATNQRGYSVDSPTWSFITGTEALPEPTVIIPEPVQFRDLDGTEDDIYIIPELEGADYLVDGAIVAAGTYPGSGIVTVTAQAQDGYVLQGTVEWTHEFSSAAHDITVTPDAPAFAENVITIPVVDGVEYLVGGVPVTGELEISADTTVTARALEGYELAEDAAAEWVFEYEAPALPSESSLFYFANDWSSPESDYVISFGAVGDEVYAGDWDGDGVDTLAIRRGHSFWVNGSPDDKDAEFRFGRDGDDVLTGDWDGDGKDTFGVRRGTSFYLHNEIAGGNADIEFKYGRHGDEILVGDWDGDRADTITVRRGHTFFVNNELTGGDAEIEFKYGRSSDDAFAGDSDGDGNDTIVLRRGHTFFVNNELVGGNAESTINYGRTSDRVLVGDWDGDGIDTPAVNRIVEELN